MRVLVIDNNVPLQAALVRLIRTWGGQADCVDTATGAREIMALRHYDVILLDIRLPTASGIWFLRNTAIPHDTKVVAMSSFVPRSLLRRLESLGVCDFLLKPFEAEELMRSLEWCAARTRVSGHDSNGLQPLPVTG